MLLRKCRWPYLALLVPLFFLPLPAWSLGLSEIEVESALNEKFDATIDLLDAGDLQAEEVLVSLATREDFERVGVERFFYLTDMTFEVEMHNGVPRVRVGSSQVISEPYLNFLVEVRWPRGRLLKEYTVLLDPPTFSSAAAPAVQAPASAPVRSQPSPTRSSTPSGDRVALAPSSARPSAPSRAVGDDEIMSTTDDTLWKIASRTLPSDRVTVNQQMLAIQRLNPDAFIRNNINLLKAGYRLQLPSESEALATSNDEAVAIAREQTQAWRDPATTQVASRDEQAPLRGQVDATASEPAAAAQPQTGEGQVRIVANSGELSQGSAANGDPAAAELIESNETLNRQVEELSYQLDREKELAASQIELKDRQLEVRDQELAQLQERLAKLESQMNSQQQNQTARAPEPEPVPFWLSPMFMGGVIGVLVLLLAWALFMVRRKSQEQEEALAYVEQNYAAEPVVDEPTEPVIDAVEDTFEDAVDDVADVDEYVEEGDPLLELDEDIAADGMDDAVADTDDEDVSADTTDVVAEADIYLAYGRYGQAVSLLAGALHKDPDQHEVRLKLLEVCVEAEDPDQFSEHADYLVNNCEDQDILMATRDLEARMKDNVMSLDEIQADDTDAEETKDEVLGEDDMLDFEFDDNASSDSSAASAGAQEDDFELEFDGDEFDLETIDEAKTDSAEQAVESVAEAEAEAEDSGLSDDLGGDLGMDFDPDKDPVEAAVEDTEVSVDAAATDQADADLDDSDLDDMEFDLELEEETPAAGGDDFDFGDEGESDINNTKLDLAEAYIDMGDGDGAQDILREVLEDGSDDQKAKAQALLDNIPS